MNRTSWWLVDHVSRMLAHDERDAVRGDLAESSATGGQALLDVLGLVVRRQAALWKDWRPWFGLMGLIVPLGMLLSIVSRVTANQSATYIWLYANNWDWALLKHAGFWYEFADSATLVFVRCLTLFCLMLVFGGLVGAPRYLAYWQQSVQPAEPLNTHNPVSAVAFYREMLPLIVQAALVAVPSLWGMRQAADVGRFPPILRVVLWTAAIGTVTVLVIQEPGFVFLLKAHWIQRIWQGWPIRLLLLVVYWPVGYLVASTIWRRWHGRAASI